MLLRKGCRKKIVDYWMTMKRFVWLLNSKPLREISKIFHGMPEVHFNHPEWHPQIENCHGRIGDWNETVNHLRSIVWRTIWLPETNISYLVTIVVAAVALKFWQTQPWHWMVQTFPVAVCTVFGGPFRWPWVQQNGLLCQLAHEEPVLRRLLCRCKHGWKLGMGAFTERVMERACSLLDVLVYSHRFVYKKSWSIYSGVFEGNKTWFTCLGSRLLHR